MNILKILKKFKRDTVIYTIVLALFASSAVYHVIYAETTPSLGDIIGSTTTNSDSTSSAEINLTSEEIDKIITDLRTSVNTENVITKLEEISKRAELSGNSALKEYAENAIQVYQLQSQLDSKKAMVEAMKKKNTDIKTLDDEMNRLLTVKTIVEDLQGAVSDETLLLLESLSEENISDLQSLVAEIEDLYNLKGIKSFTLQQRSLLDVLLLDEIINQKMLTDERLSLAQESLTVATTILKSYEKEKYSNNEYDRLLSSTQTFATKGNKTDATYAEQVIFFDGVFNMKHAPIMYDGHILVAFDDIFQYINAQIEYMYKSPNMIITSPDRKLELSTGTNIAYMNDKPVNLPVPVLNVDETLYLSAESFAQMYDISYRWIESQKCIIFYHNLNQLEDKNVPNELNRD